MPEAVLVSLSMRLTITRSCKGRSFIASPDRNGGLAWATAWCRRHIRCEAGAVSTQLQRVLMIRAFCDISRRAGPFACCEGGAVLDCSDGQTPGLSRRPGRGGGGCWRALPGDGSSHAGGEQGRALPGHSGGRHPCRCPEVLHVERRALRPRA